MKKLYIVSLGCPKNLVDSEVMLGLLEADGYTVCEDPEEADVLLLNTCGFIQPAVEEAIEKTLELAEIKKADPAKILVVTGCLVQRYGADLQHELPEVDLFLGTEGFHDIVRRLRDLDRQQPAILHTPAVPFLMNSSMPRRISTPPHLAYLKITEGCINNCSYCMIPTIRGRQRSRTIADLVQEAAALAAAGVKELTLVAQDLTAYGLDLDKNGPCLEPLLQALLAGCNIPWIRLLYLHPARVTAALLELMAREPRLLPYLDIPLQHVSSRVLRAMKRGYDRVRIEKLLGLIRQILPQAAIRTTMMVGFPGEKEEDVAEMAEFLTTQQLDHVGVFAYCNEEGCAASTLPEQVEEEVKEERRRRIMEVQADISLAKNVALIGKTEQVLVEGRSRESELLLEGRTRYQAYEIDGCVYIVDGHANPGDIVQVRFTEAQPYDLVGEITA